MIEFKITYEYKGEKHRLVGITNGAMTKPVSERRENQLTEINVFKDRQKPDERWDLGPSYIHSLYFEPYGTLYFELLTDSRGKIKRREFIGMTIYEDNEEFHTVDSFRVPFTVETRYIE